MRSVSILILGTAIMMMMMEVGAKPAIYLVETDDADEPVFEVDLSGGGISAFYT